MDVHATDPTLFVLQDTAGITIPDTDFTRLAFALLRDAAPAYLINHSVRTFLFGALLAKSQGLPFDREMLFLACILHDLGLTPEFEGPLPFEIEGAQRAKSALLAAGYSSERAEVVWDGIAMHTQAIADFKRPEIMLVSAGASMDVTGYGLEQLAPDEIRDVLALYPRLKMKIRFIEDCARVAQRFPAGANRSFMRDVAERHVGGFRPSNICDRIDSSAFVE